MPIKCYLSVNFQPSVKICQFIFFVFLPHQLGEIVFHSIAFPFNFYLRSLFSFCVDCATLLLIFQRIPSHRFIALSWAMPVPVVCALAASSAPTGTLACRRYKRRNANDFQWLNTSPTVCLDREFYHYILPPLVRVTISSYSAIYNTINTLWCTVCQSVKR